MSIDRARNLRANATPPERAMWRLLKPFRDQGFHFRRQAQIGSYYADFACHHAKLVIEVDGDTHAVGDGPERDVTRDKYLRGRGFEVLRFSNADVVRNPEGVFEMIETMLAKISSLGAQGATPTPDPSPQGGGEREASAHSRER